MAYRKLLLIGRLVIATITFSLAATITFSLAETKYDTAVNESFLDYVIPLHYNVKLRFFLEDNILFGECRILINISVALRSIWLYSVPITIINAILIQNESFFALSSASFEENNNLIHLHFTRPLLHAVYPNVFTLRMTYMRIIHKNKNGFFRYAYLKELDHQKLTETGVETMKARQLFPCRDEPAIKSTFKIAIKHHESYTVLSNMPIGAKYRDNNLMMWTDFEKSFLMSAQHIIVILTAFANYTITNSLIEGNTTVTIWCRQNVLEDVAYAGMIIGAIVPYFKQKYLMELSKLDIVAFWHSQDDNVATLGLLLLRERDIIYNEEFDPFIRKKEIAHMMARQLAFLWCENVLLWSKEGFATFFGAYILNEVLKDSDIMNLMVMQAQQKSLRYDISSIIEYIYSKNNSLVLPSNYMKSFIIWRMIYHVVPDVFWIGIRKHIDRHRNYSSTTTPDDLWTTMQTMHKDIFLNNTHYLTLKQIIDGWITQSYYPVLNVIRSDTNLTLMIAYNQSLNTLIYKTKIWLPIYCIPVTYTTQSSLNYNNTDKLIWLVPQSSSYAISGINSSDWVIVNVQQAGYYRVNYDIKSWNNLMHYLNSENYTKIHILNRAQFIDDAFYLFLHRQLSYNMFWNLTSFLLRDTNFITWYPMFKVFEFMTCIYPLQHGKKITKTMTDRIDQLVTKIGYFFAPSDDPLTVYLREETVKWACILGVPECLRTAALKLENELEYSVENNKLGKKWIYCYGLITANKRIWLMMWSRFNATNDDRFLEYLSCIEDYVIICDYLSQIIFEDIQLQRNKRASEFLLAVAKHAEKSKVLSCIFINLADVRLTSNSINDVIATLIVIITHVHSPDQMTMINNFVIHYEERIMKAVEKKMKKRRLEYGRQIRNYGHYFSLIVESERT